MASSGSSNSQRMLNLYMFDYMIKNNMHVVAENFKREAGLSSTTVGLDSPRGFLHDWWSFFYDIYDSERTELQNRRNVQQDMHPATPQEQMNQSPANTVLSDPELSSKFRVIGQYDYSNIRPQLVEQPQQTISSEDHFRDLREKLIDEELPSIPPMSNLSGQDSQEKLMVKTSQRTNENQEHDQPQLEPLPARILYKSSTTEPAIDDQNANVSPQRNLATSSVTSGFTFNEVGRLSYGGKILGCDFSSDGKLLASAGYAGKVLIWNTETLDCVGMSGTHTCRISDVRFRQQSSMFATSSWDKMIRVWDAAQPAHYLTRFSGHIGNIRSLDFHPKNTDILCSCDGDNDIRTWSVDKRACTHVSKRSAKQVRFQCGSGQLLATAAGSHVHLIDVETDTLVASLEGHKGHVRSVCWDASGQYLASVSADSVRVWSLADKTCIFELHPASTGAPRNRFGSCTFHPAYSQCLVIGSQHKIQMWNPAASGRVCFDADPQEGLVTSLFHSQATEMVASACNETVKLWNIARTLPTY